MTSPCLLSYRQILEECVWHTQSEGLFVSRCSSSGPSSRVQAAWQKQLLPSCNNKGLDDTSSINSSGREVAKGGREASLVGLTVTRDEDRRVVGTT